MSSASEELARRYVAAFLDLRDLGLAELERRAPRKRAKAEDFGEIYDVVHNDLLIDGSTADIWKFILEVVKVAPDDATLAHMGVDVFEVLIQRGIDEQLMNEIVMRVSEDARLRTLLGGVWDLPAPIAAVLSEEAKQ